MRKKAYPGDDVLLEIPLTWAGDSFFPGTDWVLTCSGKFKVGDPDSAAVFQKITGTGITVSGPTATVSVVRPDTEGLNGKTLECDIAAVHSTLGTVRTVARFQLAIGANVTRGVIPTVPIFTRVPGSPIYQGGIVQLTVSQYFALSTEEQFNDTKVYLVTPNP